MGPGRFLDRNFWADVSFSRDSVGMVSGFPSRQLHPSSDLVLEQHRQDEEQQKQEGDQRPGAGEDAFHLV